MSMKSSQNMFKYGILIAVLAMLTSGCAKVAPPAIGFIYMDVTVPVMMTKKDLGKKVGIGEMVSYVGLVSLGDASIETIAKEAGITQISHVDFHNTTYLSLYAKGTVYVYGW